MRYEGCKRGTIEPGDENIDYENWPKSQSKKAKTKSEIDGKGKTKWYNRLPYDKFVDDLPMLRYVRGSKTKISITTFDEIGKVCQQIFECNKSFFRFRVQVDLLAHYIGTKILEQIYIVKKGKKKYPLSQLLEDQEQQFLVWDQMKTIKELFSSLCEKKSQGFITEKEMDELVEKYISTFDEKDHREKMSSVLDLMMERGEDHKAKERIRQKDFYKNKQKQKEYGIQEVM